MTDTTYPADAGAATHLLTVRGATVPSSLDETRDIHNSTAGAPQSAAGARALGDLSHNVYAPIGKDLDGQLLFIDLWNSVSGLNMFFSNPQVQAAAGQLFSNRDGIVWSRLEGFGAFQLSLPSGRSIGAVGLIQVPVTSVEQAAEAFSAYAATTINHGTELRHRQPQHLAACPEPRRSANQGADRRRLLDGRGPHERVLRPLARLRALRAGVRRAAGHIGVARGSWRMGRVVARI